MKNPIINLWSDIDFRAQECHGFYPVLLDKNPYSSLYYDEIVSVEVQLDGTLHSCSLFIDFPTPTPAFTFNPL